MREFMLTTLTALMALNSGAAFAGDRIYDGDGWSLDKGSTGGADINFDGSDVFVHVDRAGAGVGATVSIGVRF